MPHCVYQDNHAMPASCEAHLKVIAPSNHLRVRRGRARRLLPHGHHVALSNRRCGLSILCALDQRADLRRRALAL